MWHSIRRLWCRAFHSAILLPIHGRYLCAVCLEEFEFPTATAAGGISVRVAPSGGKIGALNLEER